jgi:membrane protease YdiL (CAAX protease family)
MPADAKEQTTMVAPQGLPGAARPGTALTEFLRRHSLIIGIALMFLLTWPIDLSNSGALPFKLPFALYIMLGWGFIVAALTMTGLTQGRHGVSALLKRFLIWRVGWPWYLVALLLLPAITLLAVVLNAALTQSALDFSSVFAYKIFGPSANLPLFVLPFLLFDAITNGEEMGWRGYVLPRLQAKHSALLASLLLGVIWGLWHWPKFLATGPTSLFALFVVDTTAKAVLYAWLYNNTRGSLLLVTLFHAAGNTAGAFLPVANTTTAENTSTLLLVLVLEILAAALVTVVAGPARLVRGAPLPAPAG